MKFFTHCAVIVGVEARPIAIEVEFFEEHPSFEIVGLRDVAVKETRVRVRSALDQTGFAFPANRIVVTVGPEDVSKGNTSFDLAIAVAVLGAAGEIPTYNSQTMLIGELSLTGMLRPVRGVVQQVALAKREGFARVIVPNANATEASIVEGIEILVASSLRDVESFLNGKSKLKAAQTTQARPSESDRDRHLSPPDLSEIRGQAAAKRALEIAAAGNHTMLFVGPPGGGKTFLTRALPGILPEMTFAESVEVTAIHSAAGLLREGIGRMVDRPIRAPHHTASIAGIVGGGEPPRPGEFALAHNGVLFFDELPEFSRDAIESLREPLTDGTTTVIRARHRIVFPAKFQLVAAMNPCPCGYHGDPSDRCTCSDERVKRYRARVTTEFDLYVALPPVRIAQLGEPSDGATSAEVRERVARARAFQSGRGELTVRTINKHLTAGARTIFSTAAERLGISARAAKRMLAVARTIADLDGSADVAEVHIAEAVGYRTPGA